MPAVKTRKQPTRLWFDRAASECLDEGGFGSGCSFSGLTAGQFSLIDLLVAVIDRTGPIDLTIATWTAADADMSRLIEFVESGKVRSSRWLVDRSFRTRQPAAFARLVDLYGPDNIRTCSTHAKFAVLCNEEWSVLIETSMNLNHNKRIESFSLVEGGAQVAAYTSMVAAVYGLQPAGKALSGGETDLSLVSDARPANNMLSVVDCL